MKLIPIISIAVIVAMILVTGCITSGVSVYVTDKVSAVGGSCFITSNFNESFEVDCGVMKDIKVNQINRLYFKTNGFLFPGQTWVVGVAK